MLAYRFNISFEDEEGVLRVLEIKANQTFLDLHLAIQKAIGFDASKPASFYMSADHWRKGKEISTEGRNGTSIMEKAFLNAYIIDPHQKIVYISDYDEEWTLRLSLMKIVQSEEGKTYPLLVKSVGEAPKQYKIVTPIGDPESDFDSLVKNMLGGKNPVEFKSNRPAEDDDDEDDASEKKAKKTTPKPAKPAVKVSKTPKIELEDIEEGYDDSDYESYTSIDGDEDSSAEPEDGDDFEQDDDYGFDDFGGGDSDDDY